jgi:hypothetical protein
MTDVRNDNVGEGGDGTDPALPVELPDPPAREELRMTEPVTTLDADDPPEDVAPDDPAPVEDEE